MIVYSKIPLVGAQLRTQRQQLPKGGLVEVVWLTITHQSIGKESLNVIGIYVSPKTSLADLNAYLKNMLIRLRDSHTILLGDFNTDLMKTTAGVLSSLQGYKQCIGVPTTDYQSLLDHIYTNISTYELIWVIIPFNVI